MCFAGFLSGGSGESTRNPKQTAHALPVPYGTVHCSDRYVLSINLLPPSLRCGWHCGRMLYHFLLTCYKVCSAAKLSCTELSVYAYILRWLLQSELGQKNKIICVCFAFN